ncbi:MAG: hypothetical protein ABH871_07800 [Pseudomonadota bacterium]
MKKILITVVAALVASTFIATNALAISNQYIRKTTPGEKIEKKVEKDIEKAEKPSKERPEFPEKGWHKGPYVAITGGFMQVTNDTHTQTNRKFDGAIDPAFGIAFGWDIADWIGPLMQITYATATSQVGDNTVTYPLENARQHVLDFSIFVRATAPYFTRASWQPNMVKIIPYAKLGGTGHALFVNAPTDANKVGAVGGGVGVGAGCEFFIWKGFFFAIDFTENLIFQKSFYRTINGVNTKVTDGGLKAQAVLLGMLGWHF